MTQDLDERARRAGIELRSLADERAGSMRPPGADTTTSRRRSLLLAGAAAAVVGVVVVGSLVLDGSPPVLEIDPVGPTAPELAVERPPGPVADHDGWLPVPEVGQVVAAYREDFTPVFVTHPADGEVLILDPVDPHRPSEIDTLVAFCPSSGWFEDLYHASTFNAWGDYAGGPAPNGLAAYPIEVAEDGTRVRISGALRPVPARDDPRGEQQSPIGPGCDRDGEPADIVGHRPPPSPPALAGEELPAEQWTWATLVLGGEPDDIRVCAPDATCDPDDPSVTFTLGQPDTQIERTPVTYLVRRGADGRILVLHPADPTDGGYVQLTARDQALLSVPAPGTATAVALRDGTPVFATHTDEGDIHLVAAWSPDNPARLLGWCPTDQSLHGPNGRYAPDGRHLGTDSREDLATYGIDVDAVGDTHGIRVTEQPDPDDNTFTPSADADVTPSCGTELITHRPAEADLVQEESDGIVLAGEDWTWVRMRIQARDRELYLCSLADGVPDCGVPHPEYTNCVGEDPDPSTCPPLKDPSITTPGIAPEDQPRLLLARPSADGTTTQLRIPHPDP